MICKSCGSIIEDKVEKDPWCMYKLQNGKVINQLFRPDKIPRGWHDSPGAAMAKGKKKQAKIHVPQPELEVDIFHVEPEVIDGDSARVN